MSHDTLKELAATLHRHALVWDNHACLSFRHVDRWPQDMRSFAKGGIDVVSVNIGDREDTLEAVIGNAARVRRFIRQQGGRYILADTPAAILEAKAAGRIAIVLDVEGVFSIDDNLSLIELYYDLGVRWMSMVYNTKNLAGSGVHDPHDEGLTPWGQRVVREMDRIGVVKCCSHTGYRTAMDVLKSTDRPTIFSHSNPRRLCDHPRNITDELIDACAATGGVVCINGAGIFLGDNDPSVGRLVDHIEYILDRVGPDHVGIGLDHIFDHGELRQSAAGLPNAFPPGLGYDLDVEFYSPGAMEDITLELLRRGRSASEVEGVLGDNLMRVAKAVWRQSSDMGTA